MAYTNLFKKLAKAWGVEGDTNTEYGALAALAENPPFGTKVETVEILAEQSVVDETTYGELSIKKLNLEIGKNYTVIYNGVSYNCVGFEAQEEGQVAGVAIGTTTEDFTDYPFIIIEYLDELSSMLGFNLVVLNENDSFGYTLSISTEQETVTPIPQKYLPEHLQFGGTPIVLIEEQTYISNDTDGANLTVTATPEFGTTVIATHDNVVYKCIVFDFQGMPAIGNQLFFGGEDTGEPFICAWMPEGSLCLDMDTGVEHTIKCTGEKIEKIPEKYYDNKAVMFYINEDKTGGYLYKNLECTEKVTRAELAKVLNRPIILSFLGVHVFYPIYASAQAGVEHGVIAIRRANGEDRAILYTAEYTG